MDLSVEESDVASFSVGVQSMILSWVLVYYSLKLQEEVERPRLQVASGGQHLLRITSGLGVVSVRRALSMYIQLAATPLIVLNFLEHDCVRMCTLVAMNAITSEA